MLHLIVGDRDLTDIAENPNGSNIDGGGYETLGFSLPDGEPLPTMGTPVRAFFGMEPLWQGRVEEPGQQYRGRRAAGQVNAVGAGVTGKDEQIQMIYRDADLSRWGGPAVQRITDVLQSGTPFDLSSPSTTSSPTSGLPSLRTFLTGEWARHKRCEAWYDAGAGCLIDYIHYEFASVSPVGVADPSWVWAVGLADTENATGYEGTPDLSSAATGSGFFNPATARRFALIFQDYATGPAGQQGTDYNVFWKPVAYGPHNLPRRGAEPGGFYPQDIARHAYGFFGGVDLGPIDEESSYIVEQSAYREKTDPEKIVADMALLAGGWHWGVWAAPGMDGLPRGHFQRPPADATCWVALSDCGDSDLTERLSDVHDTLHVSYTDAAGTVGIVTVTRPNPRLPAEFAGKSRPLDMGRGSAATAALLGQQALALAEQQSRAAGWLDLPDTVHTPAGPRPSCLLQAGIDRIRVTGLPNSGPWTETDTRRFDTFRIRRVGWSTRNGRLQTRVEVDAGADLIEVVQARLAAATGLVT